MPCSKPPPKKEFAGTPSYTEELLASWDFNRVIPSDIVAGSLTRVVGGKLIKILIWLVSEWGVANRMLDIFARFHSMAR